MPFGIWECDEVTFDKCFQRYKFSVKYSTFILTQNDVDGRKDQRHKTSFALYAIRSSMQSEIYFILLLQLGQMKQANKQLLTCQLTPAFKRVRLFCIANRGGVCVCVRTASVNSLAESIDIELQNMNESQCPPPFHSLKYVGICNSFTRCEIGERKRRNAHKHQKMVVHRKWHQ